MPFFIQPCSGTLIHYFNVDKELELEYPHGFIIYDSTPPANFCTLGLDSFINEFNQFPEVIKSDIVKSLKKLIEMGEDKEYVIPEHYEYLLEQY